MQIQFYKKSGEKDKTVAYPKALEVSVAPEQILAYLRYLKAAKRQVSANTKDRGEVSGGGKKPWRQKGTGRARAGSNRSPIWRGGGITFGPNTERNFRLRMNKKERRAALLAIISDWIAKKAAIGVTDANFSNPKTKQAVKMIENLPIKGKVAIFMPKDDQPFYKSFRNIPYCSLIKPSAPDATQLVTADSLLFTTESLKEFIAHFSKEK